MYEKYEKQIYENLTGVQVFHPLDDRKYWNGLKEVIYDSLLKEKEYYDNYTFEPLYASLYMEFHTKQNRTNYEKKQWERRKALNVYALLEAIENEGRYMEKILDIVWMTLEETQWALPAHAKMRDGADALTYYKNHTLCLFSAALGTQLSFVYFLFKEKFDKMSHHIAIRIKEQVLERVVYEFLDRDYGYTGLMPTARGTNNWTSGVNVGVITSALVLCDDREKLAKVAAKVMASTVQQLNNYPEDGACDEGPGYWIGAVFNLAKVLECLNNMTNGAINLINSEKTFNLSNYFTVMYAFDSYVVNFADADAKRDLFNGSIYQMGKMLNNSQLVSIVNDAYKKLQKKPDCEIGINILATLANAECCVELSQENSIPPYRPKQVNYLESIQVLSVHQLATPGEGLFFAAKAGYNGESHNHNDVGTFMVYKNGQRFICDAGTPAYQAITFSDKRYTLWHTRSMYHNLPIINGYEQKALQWSREYSAENVLYEVDEKRVKFALDINNCYENREDINKWRRSFIFDREKGEIIVSEEYELKKCESIALTYLSAAPFKVESDGILMTATNNEKLKICIDTSLFDAKMSEVEIDEVLRESWDGNLYHIKLTLKEPVAVGKIEYVIR